MDHMMLTLPIFLLLSFGIVLWLLVWAKGHWFVKTSYIAAVFATIGILWISIPSFFGWSANPITSIYNTPITILGVYVEEPTKISEGGIHITIYSRSAEYENYVLKLFGHPIKAGKPRLYRLLYTRELHQGLAEKAFPSLREGNPVTGILKDGKGEGDGKGKGSGDEQGTNGGEGDGDPSQSQELKFYKLQPSEVLPKTDGNSPPEPKKPPLSKFDVA